MGSLISGTITAAQADLIPTEQHWKYHVDRWSWDSDLRRTYGIITPQLVIQNETSERLEGFIADQNGTRLDIYGEQQIVRVRFLSDTGLVSSWIMAGRLHEGYFSIEIPEEFRDTDTARIYIGNHEYTVDDGTDTTRQTWVKMNSAILYHKLGALNNLQEDTQVAQVERPVPVAKPYSAGSLIDWILWQNGMLSVGSPNSRE